MSLHTQTEFGIQTNKQISQENKKIYIYQRFFDLVYMVLAHTVYITPEMENMRALYSFCITKLVRSDEQTAVDSSRLYFPHKIIMFPYC